MLFPAAALRYSEVVVADIGTPASALALAMPDTFENDPRLWLHLLPRLQAEGNKYSRGHALVFGGYPATGAARMAARAAARMGAGLVTVAVPEAALPVYAAALTSIMVAPTASLADATCLLADLRYSGLLIGPGAGIGELTRQAVLAMLATGRPAVLDADALTSFQGTPEQLLRAMYALTAAEARLAACVAQGFGVNEAAARLGITRNTARTQLKAVFAKLGVDRQAGVVRLLTSGLPSLRPVK